MTRGGLDYQQVNLAATHTPKVVGSSLALFFPLHLKSTKFAQNLSALHPFLGQPHLITCLDQYIRLCPGPQAPVFAPQSALLQRPEGACEHLSPAISFLCSHTLHGSPLPSEFNPQSFQSLPPPRLISLLLNTSTPASCLLLSVLRPPHRPAMFPLPAHARSPASSHPGGAAPRRTSPWPVAGVLQ